VRIVDASIDHLLYGCPDLETGITEVERLTGVRPSYGGQHLGLGTHNALLSLGPRTYLEVIAPDPAQADLGATLPYGIGALSAPSLRTWAAAPREIDAAASSARAEGIDFGDVTAHSRRAPDGSDVRWQMATPAPADDGPALVPFLIDWGTTIHPATLAPGGVELVELLLQSKDPDRLGAVLRAIGAPVPIVPSDTTGMQAVLVGPAGQEVVLRS
jgi:Glyoxalase-like domain